MDSDTELESIETTHSGGKDPATDPLKVHWMVLHPNLAIGFVIFFAICICAFGVFLSIQASRMMVRDIRNSKTKSPSTEKHTFSLAGRCFFYVSFMLIGVAFVAASGFIAYHREKCRQLFQCQPKQVDEHGEPLLFDDDLVLDPINGGSRYRALKEV